MPERRGHHLLIAGVDHGPGRPVLHPGKNGVLLDPAQRRPHRPVVRFDDPLVAAHQRHDRDGLGSGQGHVPAGAVMDLAVLAALAEMRSVRHPAFEDRLEGVRGHRAGKPERRRAPARPGARFLVGRIVARVVAIVCEIAHALRGRGNHADGGYHRHRPPAGAES